MSNLKFEADALREVLTEELKESIYRFTEIPMGKPYQIERANKSNKSISMYMKGWWITSCFPDKDILSSINV